MTLPNYTLVSACFADENRYIICMKWGTKYGAEYVNRLYNMVDGHLTLPFQIWYVWPMIAQG